MEGSPERIGEFFVRRGLVTQEQIEALLAEQKRTGAPLGALIRYNLNIRGVDYCRALATYFGLPFDLIAELDYTQFPITAHDRYEYAQHRFIPIAEENGRYRVAVVDPLPETVDRIHQKYGDNAQLVITPETDLRWVIQKAFNEVITADVLSELYNADPNESAKTVFTDHHRWFLITVYALVVLVFLLNPVLNLTLFNVLLTVSVSGMLLFKAFIAFVGITVPAEQDIDVSEIEDKTLPVYTILVPMFRETRETLVHLIENVNSLDYPKYLLEVLLVVEDDDHDTINFLKQLSPPQNFVIMRVPYSEPRTKPKACNYALKFATGKYCVIFDAEDRPDPKQLKKVLKAFREGPDNLACIQCRLNYFNGRENWLTRLFAMEYTFWFDTLLPGLVRLGLPIPLGGTSNHFKTAILREMHAWDPFNVTEDADLGIRMDRLGYRTNVIPSTTWEEAVNRPSVWIRQRTRWQKGYMVTFLVHLRNPFALFRDLGLKASISLIFFVGGSFLANLANGLLYVIFFTSVLVGYEATDVLFPPGLVEIAWFNFVFGNVTLIGLNLIAIMKRKMWDYLPYVLLVPGYWFLMVISSYRALYQLFFQPSVWEKTPHGLSIMIAEQQKA